MCFHHASVSTAFILNTCLSKCSRVESFASKFVREIFIRPFYNKQFIKAKLMFD